MPGTGHKHLKGALSQLRMMTGNGVLCTLGSGDLCCWVSWTEQLQVTKLCSEALEGLEDELWGHRRGRTQAPGVSSLPPCLA